MAAHTPLLPQNATPLMRVSAEANDPIAALSDKYADIVVAYRSTPPQFMPFLVWQLGLGELSPFLPSLYDLVESGVRWQRVRGTPRAIEIGLSWLGYAATLHEDPTRRRKWSRFQIELNRVRDNDLPDLRRIDGIVSLSPPARSTFYRGFNGYDVRASELSARKLSRSILSSHSGVRIDPGKAKWSFGRTHSASVIASVEQLTALGAWIPPVQGGDFWVNADYPWASANFRWAAPAVIGRRIAIVEAMQARRAYVRFSDANGSVIGYRKALIRSVISSSNGPYLVSGGRFSANAAAPTSALAFTRVGFGDGAGRVAASMAVVIGPSVDPGLKPGVPWLEPEEASGGVVLDTVPVSIPLGLTVRDAVLINIGLDGPYPSLNAALDFSDPSNSAYINLGYG